MAEQARTSVITDWRGRDDDDLPDVLAGDEYERVITPQKFVVLHRIIVRGPVLVRLQIGGGFDVPFELWSEDGEVHQYRPKDLDQETTKKQLINVGARAVGPNSIAIVPGLEVRLVLRNVGAVPTKPRAALVVQEKTS